MPKGLPFRSPLRRGQSSGNDGSVRRQAGNEKVTQQLHKRSQHLSLEWHMGTGQASEWSLGLGYSPQKWWLLPHQPIPTPGVLYGQQASDCGRAHQWPWGGSVNHLNVWYRNCRVGKRAIGESIQACYCSASQPETIHPRRLRARVCFSAPWIDDLCGFEPLLQKCPTKLTATPTTANRA